MSQRIAQSMDYIAIRTIVSQNNGSTSTSSSIIRESDGVNLLNAVKRTHQLIQDYQLDEAAVLCSEIISNYPNDSDGYYYRGVIHAKRRLFHDAVDDLERSLEINALKARTRDDDDDVADDGDESDAKTRELIVMLKTQIKKCDANNITDDNVIDDADDDAAMHSKRKRHKDKKKKEKKKEEKKRRKREIAIIR